MLEPQMTPAECPRCGKLMRPSVVKTAIWYDDKLVVAEDVPAQICDTCMEQFYDEETTDELRRLTENGFPFAQAKGEILVPVFSLKKQGAAAAPVSEDAATG
jgi:YgiT-type zinc finger domain-containing protein